MLFALSLAFTLFSQYWGHESLPRHIDSSGFWHIASDSIANLEQAESLKNKLIDGDWRGWWESWGRFHNRVASVNLWLTGPLLPPGPLALWPMNALLLAGCLWAWRVLVRKLGGRNEPTPWLWLWVPSLLFHFTQLLRDPFYLLFSLGWLVGWVELWKGKKPWRALWMLILFAPLLYLSRERFWAVNQMVALAMLGSLLLCWLLRRVHRTQCTIALIVVVLTCGNSFYRLAQKQLGWSVEKNTALSEFSQQNPKLRFFAKLGLLRSDFLRSYPGGSTLDANVQFHSDREVIDYLPRALVISTLEPIPFVRELSGGKTGRLGAWLSRWEMSIMMLAMAATLLLLIHRRPSKAHLPCLISLVVSSTAMGLVVTNVGALYRMRLLNWLIWLALLAALTRSRSADSVPGDP